MGGCERRTVQYHGTVYRTCSGLPVLVVPVSFEIPRVVREVKISLSSQPKGTGKGTSRQVSSRPSISFNFFISHQRLCGSGGCVGIEQCNHEHEHGPFIISPSQRITKKLGPKKAAPASPGSREENKNTMSEARGSVRLGGRA